MNPETGIADDRRGFGRTIVKDGLEDVFQADNHWPTFM
jgi:hypothetical protein